MSFTFGAPPAPQTGAPNYLSFGSMAPQTTTTTTTASSSIPQFSFSNTGAPGMGGFVDPQATGYSAPGTMTGYSAVPGAMTFPQPSPSNTMTMTSSVTFATHPFQYLQECFDPNSPNFRFRFFFYNLVPGGMLQNPQGRPSLVSEALWTQTLNDNPSPGELVPVLANGFGDLTARRSWQDEHQAAQQTKLRELEDRLASVLTRQDLDVATQLNIVQRQQLKLTTRTLALMRRVEVMRKAGVRVSSSEQNLLARIQELGEELRQPPLQPALFRQMEGEVAGLAEKQLLDPLGSLRGLIVRDGPSAQALQAALQREREGLTVLIEALNTETKDIEVIRNGYS